MKDFTYNNNIQYNIIWEMKNMKNALKYKQSKKIALRMLYGIMVAVGMLIFANIGVSANIFGVQAFAAEATSDYVFLSDLDYLTGNQWSSNGWAGHEIQVDQGQEGGPLGLTVNGETRTFRKGISVHATGKVSYDISELSNQYTRFTAKVGIDAARGKNGSVWFEVLVSNDGSTWTSLQKTSTLRGGDEAIDIDVNIAGYRYLKIWVDQADGGNGADHGTIGNARLMKEGFQDTDPYTRLYPVEYYDNILSAHEPNDNYEQNYRLILEREFVRKIKYWNIQESVLMVPHMAETLDWILDSDERLEQIIEVGEITGVSKFLEVINTLYRDNKAIFGEVDGYVYQKMLIGLAAAYSSDNIASPFRYNLTKQEDGYYIERFRIMKKLYDEDKFLHKDWFQSYHVELMRMVMQDSLRNDETVWLNGYARVYKNNALGQYSWVKYVKPVYNKPEYKDPANEEKWVNQYHLNEFDEAVPYGDANPRYWMVMENGGICWNQGRFVQSVAKSIGLPSTGFYQPHHEANFSYSQDADGNGTWGLLNSITGNWGSSSTTWGGANRYRLLFDWANKSFTDQHVSGSKAGTSIAYMSLAQANLNRYEQFKKSIYLNLLANSYSDSEKKVEIYNLALAANELNLDSYDYKIQLYNAMEKSGEDWHQLALDIIDAYTYQPVAMFDLLKIVKPHLDPVDRIDIDLKEEEALITASKADSSIYHAGAVRQQANALLGKTTGDLATFSFDGENAGQIVLNSAYDTGIRWVYSLDGGVTRSSQISEMSHQLTEEELASITVENGIQIYIIGLNQSTPAFTINIEKGTLPAELFANDLENRIFGGGEALEWRMSEDSEWISYSGQEPDLTGDKVIEVRIGFTGNSLPSDSRIYTFTEDNQPNTRKYVPVSHLAIHSFSTEASGQRRYARLSIDGNYNTSYHSAWNGTDTERYITIKLDQPRYISAVEFVPAGGGNGRINDGTLYGSMDGENWQILSQRRGWTYNGQANTIEQAIANMKTFEIENPQKVEYIKIKADRTNGNWFAARHFNIFEDIEPQASIEYSITTPTNGQVVATLTNISASNYEILSEGGETHTFTENGSFTFRFRDLDTNVVGEKTAVVDWIDKVAPVGTIHYSTEGLTNQDVIATITLDDPNATITNNGGSTSYTFTENGSFTFEFADEAGNVGTATATVTWIDKTIPTVIPIGKLETTTYQIGDAVADPSEFIINKDQLPAGTTYEWLQAPSTAVASSKQDYTIEVTYPGVTPVVYNVTVSIEILGSENSGTLDNPFDPQSIIGSNTNMHMDVDYEAVFNTTTGKFELYLHLTLSANLENLETYNNLYFIRTSFKYNNEKYTPIVDGNLSTDMIQIKAPQSNDILEGQPNTQAGWYTNHPTYTALHMDNSAEIYTYVSPYVQGFTKENIQEGQYQLGTITFRVNDADVVEQLAPDIAAGYTAAKDQLSGASGITTFADNVDGGVNRAEAAVNALGSGWLKAGVFNKGENTDETVQDVDIAFLTGGLHSNTVNSELDYALQVIDGLNNDIGANENVYWNVLSFQDKTAEGHITGARHHGFGMVMAQDDPKGGSNYASPIQTNEFTMLERYSNATGNFAKALEFWNKVELNNQYGDLINKNLPTENMLYKWMQLTPEVRDIINSFDNLLGYRTFYWTRVSATFHSNMIAGGGNILYDDSKTSVFTVGGEQLRILAQTNELENLSAAGWLNVVEQVPTTGASKLPITQVGRGENGTVATISSVLNGSYIVIKRAGALPYIQKVTDDIISENKVVEIAKAKLQAATLDGTKYPIAITLQTALGSANNALMLSPGDVSRSGADVTDIADQDGYIDVSDLSAIIALQGRTSAPSAVGTGLELADTAFDLDDSGTITTGDVSIAQTNSNDGTFNNASIMFNSTNSLDGRITVEEFTTN